MIADICAEAVPLAPILSRCRRAEVAAVPEYAEPSGDFVSPGLPLQRPGDRPRAAPAFAAQG